MTTRTRINLPANFKLPPTVCSYGYFILAPHRWAAEGEAGCLHTVVRDGSGNLVRLSIRASGGDAERGVLHVRCEPAVAAADRPAIRRAVRRMLRLDEDLADWWALHAEARRRGWGRLFRSATLFEDIARTITSCNIAWPQTIRINRLLCEHVGQGAFPTAEQLARCDERFLRERCRTGYRADRLIRLGRDVVEGRLDLAWLTQPDRPTQALYERLRKIHGVGDYAARNILQHLGRYDRLPVDSELVRHFAERHAVRGTLREVAHAAAEHYAAYAPYQFLAYWYELWHDYEGQDNDTWLRGGR